MVSGVRHRIKTHPHLSDQKAKVSVVVPVFNYGLHLESCMRSVLGRGGAVVDLLILDDSSTDDSLSIAQRISEEHHRVRVIAHMHDPSHIPTMNEGDGGCKYSSSDSCARSLGSCCQRGRAGRGGPRAGQ